MKLIPSQNYENRIVGFLARYGQISLVCLVVIVLALMIIPIHPYFLDILLMCNIVASLMLLMMALSIAHPMQLTTFPSLLLMATLFRLGLNISSTRLILSRGEAGEIIQTFGYFVTDGNFVVGIIIFLVLLLVQFIVVAKGAERVAEVAARFTLDALPGKQMSIDADLRAGLITSEEAGLKRSELIKESKLYGSMDGAMKFVKGDTIAGFVITFINIIGGLIIGVMQWDMELAVAAKRFSILTIGDGLVSQIPALLISLAAGFMVTRVADEKNDQSLGSEIGMQILVKPLTLLVVAFITFLIGWMPGLPFSLFFYAAMTLTVLAVVILWRKRTLVRSLASVATHHHEHDKNVQDLGYVLPLVVELSPKLYHDFLQDDRWRHCLNVLFPTVRMKLSQRMGVPFPELKLAINENIAANRYVIKIYDIPVDEGFLSAEHCVLKNEENMANKTTVISTQDVMHDQTVHGTPIMLVHLGCQQELLEQGIAVIPPEEMFLKHVAKVMVKHSGDFIGVQEVRDIISTVEKYHPELVREVVPRLLTVQKLTDVIKRLVEEKIPVKDFRAILETLTVVAPEDKSTVDLTELIRMGLKRQITYQHTKGTGTLPCFCLDPEIENAVLKGVSKTGQDCFLTLSPKEVERINQAVQLSFKQHRVSPKQVVILTHSEVRRYVRKLLEAEIPDVVVLSFQELESSICIDQKDTISLNAFVPAH
ncbi:MAG: type III secretion system export apparatus subunit SctV [bacterium]|nr:type III secretion system export apparatus subunit SctV [bacterium]MBU1917291.1 type III secretion system export apparatus subunit SctV [bacterium]